MIPSTWPSTAASIAAQNVPTDSRRHGCPECLDGLVADRPGRHVDDPLEGDRVRVAAQDPQVGQRVLHLAALVEAGPADQLVADPVAQERLLDRPALGVRAVHHGDVARTRPALLVVGLAGQERTAATDQAFDLAGDPFGLLFLVVGLEALDRPATGLLGPQLLVRSGGVPADDGMGGVEDQLGRAVVLLELDHGGVRLVALEVEDVAQVGPTPRVDRLVVVADDAQVVVARRERPDPQVLGPVRVLVLVDVEVAPALLVAGEHGRRLLEQAHRLEQDVVEVERAHRPQPALVDPGEPGDLPFVMIEGAVRQGVGVEHLVLGPADRAEDGRRPELAGRRQVLLLEDLLHQRLLVVAVVDHEAPIEPDRRAVAAQGPGADRVERAALHLAAGLADEGHDPLAQLAGRPVGEGHGQDLPGPNAEHADEVGDAVGEDAGLAAAGAGEDEQRPLGRGHGAGLLGVQPRDDSLGQGGRGRRIRLCEGGAGRGLPSGSSGGGGSSPKGSVDSPVAAAALDAFARRLRTVRGSCPKASSEVSRPSDSAASGGAPSGNGTSSSGGSGKSRSVTNGTSAL